MPDFVYHSGGATQLISRRALDVLCDLISSDVELLPVDADFGDYAAINVLTEIKAIDEELSTGSRSSSGRIFVVEDHVFDPVPILRSGAMVFRDASRTVPAYCRHEVIERAWEHKLTGFVDPRKWLWESVKPIV